MKKLKKMINSENPKNALQKSLLDASFILAVLTVYVYLAGRLYTERYYDQFAVNYRSLDFSTATYMFNGWNVVSTSIAVLLVILMLYSLYIAASVRFSDAISKVKITAIYIIGFTTLAIFIIAFALVKFAPNFPLDLSIQVISIVAIVCLLFLRKEQIEDGSKVILESLETKGVTWLAVLITALLALWLYIMVATSITAWCHAERAKNGGMGMKITQLKENRSALEKMTQITTTPTNTTTTTKATTTTPVITITSIITHTPIIPEIHEDQSCWWLLLTRTDDDRVLLFRPKSSTAYGKPDGVEESIFVPSKAIALTRDYVEDDSLYNCSLQVPNTIMDQ